VGDLQKSTPWLRAYAYTLAIDIACNFVFMQIASDLILAYMPLVVTTYVFLVIVGRDHVGVNNIVRIVAARGLTYCFSWMILIVVSSTHSGSGIDAAMAAGILVPAIFTSSLLSLALSFIGPLLQNWWCGRAGRKRGEI